MRLSEADIALIYDLLKDYQWFVDHADELYTLPYMIVSPKERETVLRPYSGVRERIANTAPLLIKVLSMDLPAGFTLLRTIDDQCLAWNAHVTLGMHGPVSEFQARLWCWQHEHINEEIKINIIEEEKMELEVDGAAGESLEGFRAMLGGVGGSGAVLDESVIERTFNKELWGTW